MDERLPKPGGYQPTEHRPTSETREKVIDLSCNGSNQAEIAEYLDIDETTLRKHYRKELVEAKKDKTIALGKSLYRDAMDGDKQAREFWLKTQGRWSFARPPEDDKSTAVTLLEKIIDKL